MVTGTSAGPAPELLPHLPAAHPQRHITGPHLIEARGMIGPDGSVLDTPSGDRRFVMASAWIDPACYRRTCWFPKFSAMVPRDERRCQTHGRLKYDPTYELAGEEKVAVEAVAWGTLAPKLGVPRRYQHVSFETCQHTPAMEAARSCVHDGGTWIEGAVGTGKTTALQAMYRRLVLDALRDDVTTVSLYRHVAHFNYPDLVTLLLDDEERDDVLEACHVTARLLVDDWGSSYTKPNGFVAGLLEEIVIHREAEELPLLATTNLSAKAFRVAFGERVYDRIRGAWGRWVKIPGTSLRRKAEARA